MRDVELDRAVVERALSRALVGCASVAVGLGLLAVVFLVLSGSRADATTLPVVVLLLVGQLGGLCAAVVCWSLLRGVRGAVRTPGAAASSAAEWLGRTSRTVAALGAVAAVALVVLLEPRGTALLTAVVGAAVLAQAVVVLTVLRRLLVRAAHAAGG
jgi:hypothetical protein